MRHFQGRGVIFSVCVVLFLIILLTGCSVPPTYRVNPLGYGYAYDQMSSPTPHVTLPTVTPLSNNDPLLKQAGLGNTVDTFDAKYTALVISHPLSLYAFQQSLDSWPGGSILFVSFENGAQDRIPRAVQISLVPGLNHPTTYAQAEAFAQSLFPSDRTGPVTVQALDTTAGKCLAMVWNSMDLSKLFPPEDFLAGTSGKLGKPGDVVISFFPHVKYGSDHPDLTQGNDGYGSDTIDDPNIIGSLLISLGDSPAC